MKILKLLILTAGFGALYAGEGLPEKTFPYFIIESFDEADTTPISEESSDAQILQFLYKRYDWLRHRSTTFWEFIMSRGQKWLHARDFYPKDVSIDRCKQVLHAEQERIRKELDALSYKNAIFSFTFFKDIKTMRDKKRFLSEQYNKCSGIIRLFELDPDTVLLTTSRDD